MSPPPRRHDPCRRSNPTDGSNSNRDRCLSSHNRLIEGIALDRFTTSFHDEPHQFLPAHSLRCCSPGIVVNLLFDYGSVQVIGAKTQGNLRNFWRKHLPVGFYVRKIVEHQAAHGNLPDIKHASGFGEMLERCVVGMKRERDESLKSTGFVLQGSQLQQMIYAILVVLDMPVKHCRV